MIGRASREEMIALESLARRPCLRYPAPTGDLFHAGQRPRERYDCLNPNYRAEAGQRRARLNAVAAKAQRLGHPIDIWAGEPDRCAACREALDAARALLRVEAIV